MRYTLLILSLLVCFSNPAAGHPMATSAQLLSFQGDAVDMKVFEILTELDSSQSGRRQWNFRAHKPYRQLITVALDKTTAEYGLSFWANLRNSIPAPYTVLRSSAERTEAGLFPAGHAPVAVRKELKISSDGRRLLLSIEYPQHKLQLQMGLSETKDLQYFSYQLHIGRVDFITGATKYGSDPVLDLEMQRP